MEKFNAQFGITWNLDLERHHCQVRVQVKGVPETSPYWQVHDKWRRVSILGPWVQRGATGAPGLRRGGGGI